MNIYKISQIVNDNYGTYDSLVVVAENEEQARKVSPSRSEEPYERYEAGEDNKWYFVYDNGERRLEKKRWDWADIEDVQVELVGVADHRFTKPEIIVASFNAG